MPETRHLHRADLDAMDRLYRARLVNSLSGFKSANLLGTADTQGHTNLAVVSSAVHLGADPPLMGLVTRPRTVARHSVDNLLATGFYTLNHVHEGILDAAHQSSASYPREESEFAAVGLTPRYSPEHPAPYVAESRIAIGLRFIECKPIEHNGTDFIIGEIVEIALSGPWPDKDGYLDIEAAGTLAVSGLDGYHHTERLGRLSFARPGQWPHKLSD